jgi:four helix bundle protein
MARGLLAEVETHLTIAVHLGFITRDDALGVWEMCEEVGRMLNKLISSLKSAPRP